MTRTVLVTGANSGIGRATVLHLAALGFRAVGSVRSEEKAELLAKAAAEAGVGVEPVVFDLADPGSYEQTVRQLAPWGIVNNAGYMNVGAVEDVAADTVRRQFEVMVVAPTRLACLAMEHMRERGEGRIVNVSSAAAHTAAPMLAWYQACKGALSAVTDSLRAEVQSSGIDVVLIEPGGFVTAIWDKAAADIQTRLPGSRHGQPYERALSLMSALRPRMGDPAKVARAIGVALTSGRPRSRYLVGPDAAALEALALVVPRRVQDALLRRVLAL